jgi:hypothetical protein
MLSSVPAGPADDAPRTPSDMPGGRRSDQSAGAPSGGEPWTATESCATAHAR